MESIRSHFEAQFVIVASDEAPRYFIQFLNSTLDASSRSNALGYGHVYQ